MKELWLFTIRFPYGTLESSLEHELPVLCRHFQKVVIFPLLHDEGIRPLPANAEVRRVFTDPFKPAGAGTLLKYAGPFRTLWRAVFRSAPSAAVRARHRWTTISRMRQAIQRLAVFRREVAPLYDPQRVVLYSSWTLDWATVLGLWKEVDPRVHFVTRMRGFDLYHHRVPDHWQVFQAFHLPRIAHLYTTCEAARNYITGRHPSLAARTSISPTATDDHGQGPWEPAPVLRVVSCANMLPIKRVPLIAEALVQLQRPVHWTHFGDGEERPQVEAVLARPGHQVRADLHGRWSNQRIMEWYQRTPVDLFVHVSTTEGGLSVALQEAVSFGIPVIGCDTGGVSEIANAHTGLLLPVDIDAAALAKAISTLAAALPDLAGRERIRRYWAERYEARTVHERFALDLLTR
ncbi:MAG: glycosyltransferase [Flavobacteriales bacterium]